MSYADRSKKGHCSNCGADPSGTSFFTWWEKDGDNKTTNRAEGEAKGWVQKWNCGPCMNQGYEIARVMG